MVYRRRDVMWIDGWLVSLENICKFKVMPFILKMLELGMAHVRITPLNATA